MGSSKKVVQRERRAFSDSLGRETVRSYRIIKD